MFYLIISFYCNSFILLYFIIYFTAHGSKSLCDLPKVSNVEAFSEQPGVWELDLDLPLSPMPSPSPVARKETQRSSLPGTQHIPLSG